MCGIIGYNGTSPAASFIYEGLARLEYRGYDSAGIASLGENGCIELRRKAGKLDQLGKLLDHAPLAGTLGIGHTRWATHGAATEQNAHPHVCGKVAVVHNGIIENYVELREELEQTGPGFLSETDTEVIPHLINFYLDKGMPPLKATQTAVGRLKGSFALGIIFEGYGNLLIAVRKECPLVIGFAESGIFIASDEVALAPVVKNIIRLEDGDIAVITPDHSMIYDGDGDFVRRTMTPVAAAKSTSDKGNYRYFMEKEIFEQPNTVDATLRSLVGLPRLPFDMGSLSRLHIIGCGTAGYAGLVGRYWFEMFAGLSTEWEVASEFRYRESPLSPNEAGLFISQSGETADTLAALRLMKGKGYPTLAIVNALESGLSREADVVIHTLAGPEISVASTKAFTAQLVALACLTFEAVNERGKLSSDIETSFIEFRERLPEKIQSVLGLDKIFSECAKHIVQARKVFYIGRGTNYAIALEGTLKMKELSYIHAEAYAAGELKHGPLSLVDEDTMVIALAPYDRWFSKTASNIQEIVSRGGKIILFSSKEGCNALSSDNVLCVEMPPTNPFTDPILYAVAMQLLAYHSAVYKGVDVDRPRNLAKSVTVE